MGPLKGGGCVVRLIRILPVLVFFISWELVVRLGFAATYLLSPPTEVIITLFRLLIFEDLSVHILYSLFRAFGGFGLAALIAIPLGIAMAWSRLADDLASSLVELFRPIPSVALIPVAILWLGIGNASKISLISFACFFPILLNTISGVKGVDVTLIKAARSMGASDREVLRRVMFPGALPGIMVGLRISIAISLIVLIVMEMIGAAYGIGYFTYSAKLTFQTDEMYAGILTMGILGFLMNEMMVRLSRRLLVWRPEVSEY